MHQVASLSTRVATALALGCVALAAASTTRAQTYPERTIRLIVPFPPGGQTDNVSRVLGNALSVQLGQQVVIDNRAGAAGTIGSAEAARALPDGYTLLMGTASTHAINPSFMSRLPYDVVKDFAPVITLGTGPMTISVHPSVPARSLGQLIADAKTHPGRYLYGTAGVGTINHLGGEIFKSRAGGLDIVHVPYKGAGPAVNDLIGGQIPITCSSLSSVIAHHRSGRLRTLAVLKEERSVGAPEIPTAAEAGLDDAVAYTFNMIFVPAATPRGIVERLSTTMRQIAAERNFAQTMIKMGVDPIADSDPSKAAAMLRTEIARYKPVIHALALRQ
ncbi:MAG: tripartite tricarboxylate transporter substrate binding protein [Burkholderiales bacterium]|nr:tripartite tricarboxylate transporter substrate binding protein [Burkholderiales bacterium]